MGTNNFIKFIKKLQLVLKNNHLPGMDIMAEMAPSGRSLDYPNDSKFIKSAVGLILFKKNSELYFILIKRTSFNENDKHGGQISFPGGRLDKVDSSMKNCAIREVEEELGIDTTNLSYIGKLTKLFIPVSNYMVYPFVFYTDEIDCFYPQESEVEYVLEVKLNDLFDEENVKLGEIEVISGINIKNIPYFDLNNHVIWGATAMILNEFKNVVKGFKTK